MAGNGDSCLSAMIHQASGMVAAQAGCTPDEALTLMIELALEVRRTLDEVAAAIIDGSVRFDDSNAPTSTHRQSLNRTPVRSSVSHTHVIHPPARYP